jgi:hypothetical protein
MHPTRHKYLLNFLLMAALVFTPWQGLVMADAMAEAGSAHCAKHQSIDHDQHCQQQQMDQAQHECNGHGCSICSHCSSMSDVAGLVPQKISYHADARVEFSSGKLNGQPPTRQLRPPRTFS